MEKLNSAERDADHEGDWSVMGQIADRRLSSSEGATSDDTDSLKRLKRSRDSIVPLAKERCEGRVENEKVYE